MQEKMYPYGDIGKRITEIRHSLNLSQERFANKLNISRTSVIRYENGERLINSDIILKISSLGFSVNWLLNDYGSMKESDKFVSTSDISGKLEISRFRLYRGNRTRSKNTSSLAEYITEVQTRLGQIKHNVNIIERLLSEIDLYDKSNISRSKISTELSNILNLKDVH